MARLVGPPPAGADDQDVPDAARPFHTHPHLMLGHTHLHGEAAHRHTPEPGCNGRCHNALPGGVHHLPCLTAQELKDLEAQSW